MTNKIKLPPLPLAYQAAYEIGKDMQAYATQAVTEDRAQRDADNLAELQAYELTVSNLREQLALRGEPTFWLNEVGQLSATRGFAARNAPGLKLIPLYTHPQAPREQLMDKDYQDSWNRECRLIVDTFLHEAGYHEDSFVRRTLVMMNLDASPAVVEQLAQQASQVAHPDNLEQIIDDYVDDYVMEGDDGTHWPAEDEKCLIKDAVMGLLADPEWNSAWGKIVEGSKQAPQAQCGEPVAWIPPEREGEFHHKHSTITAYRTPMAGWEPVYRSAPALQVPMTEDEIIKCLVESNCIGKVMMSFESGPYDITRTSINADRLVRAIEAHHGIKEQP